MLYAIFQKPNCITQHDVYQIIQSVNPYARSTVCPRSFQGQSFLQSIWYLLFPLMQSLYFLHINLAIIQQNRYCKCCSRSTNVIPMSMKVVTVQRTYDKVLSLPRCTYAQSVLTYIHKPKLTFVKNYKRVIQGHYKVIEGHYNIENT